MAEDNKWIRLNNGNHIPIKEGQSVEDAIKELQSRSIDELKKQTIVEIKTPDLSRKTFNETGIIKKKKSIRTFNKRIEEHKNKISNPEIYYPEWESLPENIKKGNIDYWKKEINTYKKEKR